MVGPALAAEEWLESDICGTDGSQCSKAIDFECPGFDTATSSRATRRRMLLSVHILFVLFYMSFILSRRMRLFCGARVSLLCELRICVAAISI